MSDAEKKYDTEVSQALGLPVEDLNDYIKWWKSFSSLSPAGKKKVEGLLYEATEACEEEDGSSPCKFCPNRTENCEDARLAAEEK